MNPTSEMRKGATFSEDRVYRYSLTREWDGSKHKAMFVGLNPSTADETIDDPTVRRCIRFARDWGFGGLVMTNLFAFRATDPKDMKAAEDPVGPLNDWYLRLWAHASGVVVAAWGVHGEHLARADAVVKAGTLNSFTVLGLTKAGHPKHPLYLKADSVPLDPLSLKRVELIY